MKNEEFNSINVFRSLPTVKKIVDEIEEIGIRNGFCDKEHGIFGYWEGHKDEKSGFEIKPDPGYYGMQTIYVKNSKSKFDECPYFDTFMSQDDCDKITHGLSVLCDLWAVSDDLINRIEKLYSTLHEATFEHCHMCDEDDDRQSDVSEMKTECQKGGVAHTGCFVQSWRRTLRDTSKFLGFAEGKK